MIKGNMQEKLLIYWRLRRVSSMVVFSFEQGFLGHIILEFYEGFEVLKFGILQLPELLVVALFVWICLGIAF